MAKNSLRIWKDVLLRYIKMVKVTGRLPTPWNWATAQWLRSSGVLKELGPLSTGLGLVVQRSWAHVLSVIPKCFLWKIGVGVQSALLQRLKSSRVSMLVLRPSAALYIKFGVHDCHSMKKPLLKMIHKNARKQFAEDISIKHMDCWNHVLWSDEMKINLFASDGFKHVWRWPGEEYKNKCVMPTVKYDGGNVMVWGCMSAAGVEELHFIEWNMNSNMYCKILQQIMILSLQKLGRRAMFQHHNNTKHTSKTTIALLKKLRVTVMDWPSMSPDLNPIEHLWGILKRKVEVHKVSNIRQVRDVVMEEWKSIPVTICEALVKSMPRRVKAVLDNGGGHTKYWQLTWCMLILTTFRCRCTHFCWQGFSFYWLCLKLFWGDNKLTLLYKLHTDYFSLCQSVILSVLS